MTLYSPSLTSKPRYAVKALYNIPRECGNRSRIRLQNGSNDAIEFQERLFVKHYVVEGRGRNPTDLQAELDRPLGKVVVVFPTREPLFLRGGDYLAVANKGRCGVVIE